MKLKWWCVIVCFLATINSLILAQDSADVKEHLSAWRAVDETWRQGMTIRGEHIVSQSPLNPDLPPYTAVFELTGSGGQIAVREVTEKVEEVASAVATNRSRRLGLKDAVLDQVKATSPVGVVKTVGTIFDGERSKQARWFMVFSVDEAGVLKPEGPSAVSELHGADSQALVLPTVGITWVVGRGLASHLADVISAVHEADMLRVKGAGSGLSGHSGNWDVVAAPKQGYLVRKAIFTPSDKRGLRVEVENMDFAVSNGVAYPKRGTLKIGSPGVELTHRYIFNDVDLSFSRDLFNSVVKEVDSPLPNGSMVVDESQGKVQARIVGMLNRGDEVDPVPIKTPNRATVVFVLVANVLVLAFLSIVWVIRSRSRRTGK